MARLLLALSCLPFFMSVADGAEPVRYEIDDEKSWVHIQVFRGGLLAGFGHNHVVSVHDLAGIVELAENIGESTLRLEFPVTSLAVDQPDDRKAEGERFNKRISEKSIASTRRNMLGEKLLQGDTYPLIVIASSSVSGVMPDLNILTQTTVRDHMAEVAFPAHVVLTDPIITVTGSLQVSQDALGLGRFKAALGALRVKNELTIRYSITATRL